MAKYEVSAEARVGIRASVEAVYSEATFKRIVEDAIFFRRKATEDNINDAERKRYSRIVILLMAFYLESLSNLLCDAVLGEDWKGAKENKEKGVAEAIIKFKAVHKKLYDGKELALRTDGIQDIFTIRNKVIAHPAGRAKLRTRTGDVKWNRIDKEFGYKKFTNFPLVYSHFTLQEADSVLTEVKDFLIKFHDLLKHRKDKVPEDALNTYWPKELVEWSKEVPKR